MNVPNDTCPEIISESWSDIDWSMSDGTSGGTGCHGPIAQSAVRRTSSGALLYSGEQNGSNEALPAATRVSPVRLPTPLCAPPSFEISNVPFVTGSTGPVAEERYLLGGTALQEHFYIHLGSGAAGTDGCIFDGTFLVPTRVEGGVYEVTQGGTWGEEIEFEIRDVSWSMFDGRTFTIDRGRWHYRLPNAPVDMP